MILSKFYEEFINLQRLARVQGRPSVRPEFESVNSGKLRGCRRTAATSFMVHCHVVIICQSPRTRISNRSPGFDAVVCGAGSFSIDVRCRHYSLQRRRRQSLCCLRWRKVSRSFPFSLPPCRGLKFKPSATETPPSSAPTKAPSP